MPSIEVIPTSPGAPQSTPQTAPPIAPVPAAMPLAAPSAAPQTPAASAADDTQSDELDAEWVEKAKAIVEQTKDDPHRESHELGKAKADYLRIRYNKTIKVAEE